MYENFSNLKFNGSLEPNAQYLAISFKIALDKNSDFVHVGNL